jgi:TfoX/Sxy family transcriptional regulator of competence genes
MQWSAQRRTGRKGFRLMVQYDSIDSDLKREHNNILKPDIFVG